MVAQVERLSFIIFRSRSYKKLFDVDSFLFSFDRRNANGLSSQLMVIDGFRRGKALIRKTRCNLVIVFHSGKNTAASAEFRVLAVDRSCVSYYHDFQNAFCAAILLQNSSCANALRAYCIVNVLIKNFYATTKQ